MRVAPRTKRQALEDFVTDVVEPGAIAHTDAKERIRLDRPARLHPPGHQPEQREPPGPRLDARRPSRRPRSSSGGCSAPTGTASPGSIWTPTWTSSSSASPGARAAPEASFPTGSWSSARARTRSARPTARCRVGGQRGARRGRHRSAGARDSADQSCAFNAGPCSTSQSSIAVQMRTASSSLLSCACASARRNRASISSIKAWRSSQP